MDSQEKEVEQKDKPKKKRKLYQVNRLLALERAKLAYFRGSTAPQIQEWYGIPKATVEYHIQGRPSQRNKKVKFGGDWKRERSEWIKKATARALAGTAKDLKEVARLGVNILRLQFLAYLRESQSGQKLGIKDLKLVSDVFANLDRAQRLDEGKPTSHSLNEYVDSSPEQIQNEIKQWLKEIGDVDPMIDYGDESPTGSEEPPVH